MMFSALTAAESLDGVWVAFIHLPPAAWTVPDPSGRRALMETMMNGVRVEAGLPQAAGIIGLWARSDAVVTTIRAMDPIPASPRWRYVGPVRPLLPDSASASRWQFSPSGDESGPLVLVSLSTTDHFGDRVRRLQAVLAALADEPVQVLLTAGPAVDVSRLAVPANAAVRDYVPHADALRGAVLCVSHAGHGTVMAALAAGVPLLCLPNPMADQPYNAMRIEELGAGLSLAPDSPPEVIRAAARKIMATPSYRQAAGRLQSEIAATSGAEGAAEELERMARARAITR